MKKEEPYKNRKVIPPLVTVQLWTRAGGRCQYEGCNEPLWRDPVTMRHFNLAYVAHIVAAEAGGPRGHPTRSKELCESLDNLMLMCDAHHRLIDRFDEAGHPEERLRTMKRMHEERIERLTGIHPHRSSEILLYGANIGAHNAPLSYEESSRAIVPDYYPTNSRAIEFGLKHSTFRDDLDEYWTIEESNLCNHFNDQLKRRLGVNDIRHLSVFALAPQPLLIRLGSLLGDIHAVEVYQRAREPQTWNWREETNSISYSVTRPTTILPTVALNTSLSAAITPERIHAVLGSACSVWTLTVIHPYNDFLRTRQQLAVFRQVMRSLLNEIKQVHGQDAVLHLFPAMPNSTAVELGRLRMPKADLPFLIYDQSNARNGFIPTLKIS